MTAVCPSTQPDYPHFGCELREGHTGEHRAFVSPNTYLTHSPISGSPCTWPNNGEAES